jgi:hypothetical protein
MIIQSSLRSPLQFQFVLSKTPLVNFDLQQVSIPEISGNIAEQVTPFLVVHRELMRLNFGSLNLTFLVDAHMRNYLEIYRWITGIGAPEGTDQFNAWADEQEGKSIITDDAILTVLDASNNPVQRIQFPDIFPTHLGSLTFTTTDTDVNYLTCQATFAVTTFKVL